MGGGTFGTSPLTIGGGFPEPKSTAGDVHLGGEDFDNRDADFCMQDFMRKSRRGKYLAGNQRAIRRLRTQRERAKRILSLLLRPPSRSIRFCLLLVPCPFRGILHGLLPHVTGPVEKALRDSGIDKKNIHELVLACSLTRFPKVQAMIQEFVISNEPTKSIYPDEAVAF
ncbi:unnamed protein product [Polarella glacialis]|uniref:Uncharacterized protein n=1 Tax=Polarella glacialis TaxID=89957 RepID=A0A813LRU6_POLGL|nr:unnamed protein product [Polarella glacialis]CAE8738031.1 unnamed protein product [Polarella glacialis]